MWKSLHVHYRDDNRCLLLQAVRPFIERVDPVVQSSYFTVHWLRGPHVRINIDASPQMFDDVVLPVLHEVVGSFLTAHPSRALINEPALLGQHQRLAELEHEDGPLGPLLPDNSIHVAPYERRVEILGSEAAADLLAEFYRVATPMAFETLENSRTHAELLMTSFDMMIATAHVMSEVGLARGFVSFRSHAEAFLSWWPEAEGLREHWDQHYRVHARSLTDRVQLVMEQAGGRTADRPPVRRWMEVLDPIRDRARDLIASGELSMDPPWAGQFDEDDDVIRDLASKSTFHNHVRPAEERIDEPWFARYRLMLNDTYLQMTRLGVTPVERFLLCHLAANAAEDMFGVLAQDVRLPAPGEVGVHG